MALCPYHTSSVQFYVRSIQVYHTNDIDNWKEREKIVALLPICQVATTVLCLWNYQMFRQTLSLPTTASVNVLDD